MSEHQLYEISVFHPSLAGVTTSHIPLECGISKSIVNNHRDVIVHLCNVEDEADIEEVTVLSLPAEITKVQSIAYDLIEREVRHNLQKHGVADDIYEHILKQVENKLEDCNVRINY